MPLPLQHRRRLDEVMDDPALPAADHAVALAGLARINHWSDSAGILYPPLRRLAQHHGQIRVLDVATGGGNVPINLFLKAQHEKINLHVDACDRSDQALDHARANARAAGANINFFQLDALRQPIPKGYDAVISSLFLHHVDEPDVNPFLQNLAAAAGRTVLINDLTRSVTAHAVACLFSHLLSRSPIVHVDAPRSVRAAFTLPEIRHHADAAGLHNATIHARFPFRFLLEWNRP